MMARSMGLVTVRTALGSSYNIPAVRALQKVGLPNFLALAQRLGITTLTRPDYGLSLSLGGGEMPLMELTGAYAVLANGGATCSAGDHSGDQRQRRQRALPAWQRAPLPARRA